MPTVAQTFYQCRWQLTLRTLLCALMLIAFSLGVYVRLWETLPLVPALYTVIAVSTLGIVVQQKCHFNGRFGAVIGGAIGGVMAVLIHLACGYTLLSHFGDRGLGFVGSLWSFGPIGALFGVLTGSVIELVSYALLQVNRYIATRPDKH